MAINRYSNLSQAKFNPLSFQELSALPFAQRKQHDAMTDQAIKAGIIQSQRMAADEEAVSGAINAFQAKTDDYINRLDSEGFNNASKSEIRELARERKDLMSTGIVGQKQAQYDRYAANMKQLNKDRDKISPYKYQALQQKAVEDYNNAIKEDPNASYQDVLAVKDYDIQKDARQIAKDVQGNPQILTNFGFTPITGAPGQYWNSKTQTKYTGKGDIANAIYSIMGQNREVMDDLYQRESLGLLGDQSATDYLKNVGLSFEGYGVNQETKSRSGFTNQMQVNQLKKELETGVIDFEKFNHKNIELHSKSDMDMLSNIANGKQTVDMAEYTKNGEPGLLTAFYDSIFGNVPLTPKKFESINDPLKDKSIEIFNGLKRTGQIADNANITDPAILKQVVNYMKDHQVNMQQAKIGKVNISESVNKAKDIVKNARSRVFYSPDKNTTYTYQEMVDNGFLKENDAENFKNISYVGQMSSDNVYPSTINSEYRDSFISPHVITLGKDQFLVPGSESEMKSPYMKNERAYNENYNKLYRSADLPVPFKWNNDGVETDVEVIQLTKNNKYYAGENKPYLISVRENGETSVQYLTAEEFKNMQSDLK